MPRKKSLVDIYPQSLLLSKANGRPFMLEYSRVLMRDTFKISPYCDHFYANCIYTNSLSFQKHRNERIKMNLKSSLVSFVRKKEKSFVLHFTQFFEKRNIFSLKIKIQAFAEKWCNFPKETYLRDLRESVSTSLWEFAVHESVPVLCTFPPSTGASATKKTMNQKFLKNDLKN